MSETQTQERLAPAPSPSAEERRAARAKPSSAAEATTAEGASDEITYIPGDGDPARTIWNNIEFKAHVPVKILRSQTVSVPLPIRTPMKDENGKPVLDDDGKPMYHNGIVQPDGTIQTRHVEQRVKMVELARTNPAFSVNGAPPPVIKKGTARVPTSPETYRGYALRWIMMATSASDMDTRWIAETELRASCGCDEKDDAFLRPFFDAKLDQVKTAA